MYVGCGRCEMILPEDDSFPGVLADPKHPLMMRALTLGLRQPAVLVSVDMAFLSEKERTKLQALAATSAVTKPEKVRIAVTGTISAPSVVWMDPASGEDAIADQKWLKTLLRDTVHTAVLQARASSMETEVSRPEEENALFAVSGLTLLRFGRETPRAFLLYRTAASFLPDIMGDPDEAAARVCAALEEQYPDAVAFFLSDPEIAAELDSLLIQKDLTT